jgi:peptidoglycan hydrolase-like protein with peptidoglycan-binding domain
MTGYITMFDAVDIAQIPSGATAVAGYVDGNYQTASHLAAMLPHASLLTIAVTAADDADCLDIETGDATPADAAGWYGRQRARGITRPCLYASAGLMESSVAPLIRAAGIARSSVRLWSAHYTGAPHICGPSSCGAMSTGADGTQWTDAAYGRDLDESLLTADFFGTAPVPAWQEAMMSALPVLQQGSKDAAGRPFYVRRVQVLVSGIGRWNALGSVTQLNQDGVYGPATAAAVKRVQEFFRLTQDGIAGPSTWAALIGG